MEMVLPKEPKVKKLTAYGPLHEYPDLVTESNLKKVRDALKGGYGPQKSEELRQVANLMRIPNDSRFRKDLYTLFGCLTTMELGLRRALKNKQYGVQVSRTVPIPDYSDNTGIVRKIHTDFRFTVEGSKTVYSSIYYE